MNAVLTEDIKVREGNIMQGGREFCYYNYICDDSYFCNACVPHYHDYYEIVFYLGKNPGKYAIGERECTVEYGDVVFLNIFEPHMFLVDKNEGYERFHIGIDAGMLMLFSGKTYNLFDMFDSRRRNYPVTKIEPLEFGKYIEILNILRSFNTQKGKELQEKLAIFRLVACQRCMTDVNTGNDPRRTDLFHDSVQFFGGTYIAYDAFAFTVMVEQIFDCHPDPEFFAIGDQSLVIPDIKFFEIDALRHIQCMDNNIFSTKDRRRFN